MKLKGLELQGFKTFPDRTKLDFTNGITAVVGPNGSGKSNISDAIRWVLGEQSAKSLRCSRMEDVIFNGTQQRKKTGYAQVTLSIDNSDRTLQFDGDEVSVTRRFYRSGNSEYLINNTNVRLQDIHELFMDTGLGRDGYSMIGQGKIDSIVSTKGEDRREIFEEAAGISRFRYKKAEAERRLERTEENLVRLRDNLFSLESRVEPLRQQSEKAKAYLGYAEEKRGLEIALWLKALDKASQQIRVQADKLAVAQAQYDDIGKELESICAESEKIYNDQSSFGAKIDEIRRSIALSDEQAAAKRSEISVLQNDILHNENTAERSRIQIEEYERSGVEIQAEIAEKRKLIEKNESTLKQRQSELELNTKLLASLKSDESSSNERLDEINELISELSKKAAEEKITYMTSSTTINDITSRSEIVENNIRARKSQMGTLENIISEYTAMLGDNAGRYSIKQKELAASEKAVAKAQEQTEKLKAESDDLKLESSRLFGKARTLEDLERNLEGFLHSVKLVMKESKTGTLSGIHGPVSRVIKTSSEYSVAIEIALGGAMQNIVTETDSDAKRAISFLKSRDGGRATFLPMSTIKGRELSENGLESCSGFVGIASSLCTCEEIYKGILFNLLGRIVIAKDLDSAVEIAKKYSYRFRIVTLDGQVVNTGGSLTGGSLAKNTGLLSRASEIEKIRAKAQELSAKAQEKLEKWQDSRKTLSTYIEGTELCRRELTRINEERIKIEAEIKSRKSELDNIRASYNENTAEREENVKRLDELTRSMNEARRLYDEYTAKISKNEELVQVLSGSRNENAKKREKLGEKLHELSIAVLTCEKDIAAAQNDINGAELRAANAKEAIKQCNSETKALAGRNEEIRSRIAELEEENRKLSEKTEGLNNSIIKLNADRMTLEKRSAELRKSERDKTADREGISAELVRLEERRDTLQKQYDEINGKLWEEYELTRREAEKAAADVSDQGKAQRRLAELKQKIRSLGTVNVGAIEEYKEVSEQYEFMKVQVGDVEKSKSELIRLIGELTKQMREIFIERFKLINTNFSSTFVELFGGGKASLSLSDPENVLTTGIDISVEPPGKIVSHIELLSGGEKALVAIALYFAIMKVSPSPFCVMDEIEAALDDVNVYRFAAYLRRMNANTQFICITHRRGTMEEADVLYGVTMQDRGISKLLQLQASDIEKNLSNS